MANVFGLQERLKGLGLVEAVQDAHLLVVRRLFVGLLEVFLEPLALLGVLQVGVFNAHGSAIRITHQSENFAKQHRSTTSKTADNELTVEVPERQPVVLDLEVGVGPLLVLQRVNVRHAVPANAERLDEFLHTCGFVDCIRIVNLDVFRPANRLVGDAKRRKDVFVKSVFTDEEAMNNLEELTRAGALNHTVVIRRRQRDGFRDSEVKEDLFGRSLEFGGVIESTSADDAPLTAHQSRNRVNRADTAGVCERHGVASEIVGG